MKRIWVVLLWSVSVLLQMSQFGWSVKPNWLLVSLIFLSATEDLSDLMWYGFAASLVMDIFSGSNFGLNMAFFLLLSLIAKAVFRLGEIKFRTLALVSSLMLATISYNVVLALPFLQIGSSPNWLSLSQHIGLEILYNVVILLLLVAVSQFGNVKNHRARMRAHR